MLWFIGLHLKDVCLGCLSYGGFSCMLWQSCADGGCLKNLFKFGPLGIWNRQKHVIIIPIILHVYITWAFIGSQSPFEGPFPLELLPLSSSSLSWQLLKASFLSTEMQAVILDKIRNTEQVDKIPEIRLLLAEFEESKEAGEYGPRAEGDTMLQLDLACPGCAEGGTASNTPPLSLWSKW